MTPARILVVDDDHDIGGVMKILLEKAGYEPLVINNPLSMQLRKLKPDLMLLDIRMPEADGRDICHMLKATPEFAGLPIILLSASPNLAYSAMEAGADAFIEKPFNIKHLLDTVERLLNKSPDQVLEEEHLVS